MVATIVISIIILAALAAALRSVINGKKMEAAPETVQLAEDV